MKFTQHNREINRFVLNNGITIISVENPTADIIAARIFVRNTGTSWDALEKAGLSYLIAAVITKGTESLSSIEIAEQIESIGASLSADAAADYFLLSIKTVSADFAQILKLASQILRSPIFSEIEVELEKNLTRQSIRSQLEQPFNIAFNQLKQAMYPNHPYGVSLEKMEETLGLLSRDDLQRYHQNHFRPDNLTIALSGRITHDRAVNLINELFGDWKASNTSNSNHSLPTFLSRPCQRITSQETQQSVVMLGYLAAEVRNKDYPVLKLLTNYLGNGLSSRLFVELREKRGLAYDVSAFYPTRSNSSQFVAYIGTAPENTSIALEGLRAEVERLCHDELSEEELQATKNKLLGQYALGKQTNGELAQLFGWYETLGLGIEFDTQFQQEISEVTPQMLQTVARKYLLEPYISIVGPAAAVRF